MNILIGYASAHGSTAEIAQFMGRVFETFGAQVTTAPVSEVHDISNYDAVVVGSAIHANMWLQPFSIFLEQFADALSSKPTHLFITCIRVMEPGGRAHALRDYLYLPMLAKIGVSVEKVAVMAGKVEINAISWDERWLLASNYDGSAGSKLVNHDYRDWAAIGTWAMSIAAELKLKPTFE
jgi:menaquinone-dependent protoporphyrinogen oxidase